MTLTLTGSRLVIVDVVKCSLAERVGLAAGDEIEAVKSIPIRSDMTKADVLSLFDFGVFEEVAALVRRRTLRVHSKILHVWSKTHRTLAGYALWELRLAFVETGQGLVIVDVATGKTSSPLSRGDVILAVDGSSQGLNDALKGSFVSKVWSSRDSVSVHFRRERMTSRVEVGIFRRQRDVESVSKLMTLSCVGMTLDVSDGRAVVAAVGGNDTQAVAQGVGVGWAVREVRELRVEALLPFEIEAALARADCDVTFGFDGGCEKKLRLWRDDISHLQLLLLASRRLQHALNTRAFKKADDCLTSRTSASFESAMAVDVSDVAAHVRLIDVAVAGKDLTSATALKEIEALAGVLERQIVGCVGVHFLSQFYLLAKLLLWAQASFSPSSSSKLGSFLASSRLGDAASVWGDVACDALHQRWFLLQLRAVCQTPVKRMLCDVSNELERDVLLGSGSRGFAGLYVVAAILQSRVGLPNLPFYFAFLAEKERPTREEQDPLGMSGRAPTPTELSCEFKGPLAKFVVAQNALGWTAPAVANFIEGLFFLRVSAILSPLTPQPQELATFAEQISFDPAQHESAFSAVSAAIKHSIKPLTKMQDCRSWIKIACDRFGRGSSSQAAAESVGLCATALLSNAPSTGEFALEVVRVLSTRRLLRSAWPFIRRDSVRDSLKLIDPAQLSRCCLAMVSLLMSQHCQAGVAD